MGWSERPGPQFRLRLGPCYIYSRAYCSSYIPWPRNRAPFPFTYIFSAWPILTCFYCKNFGFRMYERVFPLIHLHRWSPPIERPSLNHIRVSNHIATFPDCVIACTYLPPPIAIPLIHSPPLIWSSDQRPALNHKFPIVSFKPYKVVFMNGRRKFIKTKGIL